MGSGRIILTWPITVPIRVKKTISVSQPRSQTITPTWATRFVAWKTTWWTGKPILRLPQLNELWYLSRVVPFGESFHGFWDQFMGKRGASRTHHVGWKHDGTNFHNTKEEVGDTIADRHAHKQFPMISQDPVNTKQKPARHFFYRRIIKQALPSSSSTPPKISLARFGTSFRYTSNQVDAFSSSPPLPHRYASDVTLRASLLCQIYPHMIWSGN